MSVSATLARRARTGGALAGVFVIAIAVADLAGWALGINVLKHVIARAPAMMPNTALCLSLGGVALLSAGPGRLSRWIRGAAASAMLVVGAATLAEWISGRSLGIDHLLFSPPAGSTGPLRMAYHTAANFILVGGSLLLLDARGRIGRVLRQVLPFLVLLVALLALSGHVYGVAYLYSTRVLPLGMALHTAVAFIALALGTLASRPESGIVATIADENAGGTVARRLLLGALLIPLLGEVAVIGQTAGVYPPPGAAALSAVGALGIAVVLVLATAHSLNQSDAARRKVQDELRVVYEREGAALREITREKAILGEVLRQMPEGVLVLDAKGHLWIANRAAEALMAGEQGPRDEWGNPVVFDLRRTTGEPLPLEDLPLVRAMKGEDVSGYELVVRTKRGDVPLLASASPLRSPEGETLGAIAVFHDVSSLKELERLREEWTSVVAHDLRAPLTTIELSAELLKERGVDPGSIAALDRIRSGVRKLERMISDLLDSSRIEAKRLALSKATLDLATLVRTSVESIAPTFQGRDVNVDTPATPLLVDADPQRIDQVLTNLLTNAAKYGVPGTGISVSLRRADGAAEISVVNHGTIPKDEIPLLFSRFHRTKSAREGGQLGLGLGLYICRGLVEAHGGRIWVESDKGLTAFRVLLPTPAAAERAAGRSFDTPAPGR